MSSAAVPPTSNDTCRYPNDGDERSEQKHGSRKKVSVVFLHPSMPREHTRAERDQDSDRQGKTITHAASLIRDAFFGLQRERDIDQLFGRLSARFFGIVLIVIFER